MADQSHPFCFNHNDAPNLFNGSGSPQAKLERDPPSERSDREKDQVQAKRQKALVSSLGESYVLSPNLIGFQESCSKYSGTSNGIQATAPYQSLASSLRCSRRWNDLKSYCYFSIFILLLAAFTICFLRMKSLEREVLRLEQLLKGCSRMPLLGLESKANTVTQGNPDFHLDNPNNRERHLALIITISVFVVSVFLIKYDDKITFLYQRRRTDERNEEEAPLSKHLAYRMDVLFSTCSYAKSAALLLATMVLITMGAILLYLVSGQDVWDSLWCSWTYVADSGNHVNSVGMGPRIVSVCISIGGMLIFALMLGLVSDAISEKVDSLRKGKSEVIESNHTVILGWSDKLVTSLTQSLFPSY